MSDKNTVFEEIHRFRTDCGQYSENLIVLLDELREHLDKAPIEHRCNVTFELAAYDNYGSEDARVTLGYNRPLTTDEIEETKRREREDIFSQYQWTIKNILELKSKAEKAGIPLDELGLSSTANYIELRR